MAQLLFQSLSCGLQNLRCRAKEQNLHVVPARPAGPRAETNRFGQRMLVHSILQRTGKGRRRKGPAVRINQRNLDRAKLIGLFRLSSRNPAPGISAHLRNGKRDRVHPVALLKVSRDLLNRALHLAHHRHRVLAARARQHGKVTCHRALLRRREKAPLHVTLHKQSDLRGKQQNGTRNHRVAKRDDACHQRSEKRVADPGKQPIDLPRWPVIPRRITPNRVAQVVGQDEKAFH